MVKELFKFYKIPLLISLVLFIVMASLISFGSVLDVLQILLGALLGAIFLDLEFFLYAYLFEPQLEFSKTLLGYLKHKDIGGAIIYVNYHKEDIKDKSLNSAVFQLLMVAVSALVIFATTYMFIKVFVLSIFANSIYRGIENYYHGKSDEWFWVFKNKPTRRGVGIFFISLTLILIFFLTVFQ